MTTKEISNRLVALCRAGKNVEAVETLLGEDVISVEATGDATMPAVMAGREVVRGKNEWWLRNHKIHSAEVRGPFPNGDRFAVIYNFVVTPAAGRMAGKKMSMEEVAIYTVSEGKITREEFFYDMSGASNVDAQKPPSKTVRKKPAGKKATREKAPGKAR